MIILSNVCGSLEEYLAAAGAPGVEAPAACARCSTVSSFRRHSGYCRKVIEGQRVIDVKIPRFMCGRCRLVISVLFGFLLPYRRFTVRSVAAGVEGYATEERSYRHQAYELSCLAPADHVNDVHDEVPVRPAASQVFRWVKSVLSEWLLLQVQKELVLSGKPVPATSHCPNAARAATAQKERALDTLSTVIAGGSSLLGTSTEIARCLHAYFLVAAESKCAFLIGIPQKCSVQQSLQYVIF